MVALLEPLTFIDTDENRKESHRIFPVGTPITASRATAEANDEQRVCESACAEYHRKGNRNFQVMMLGGHPRILHRKYFDTSYKESDDATHETRRSGMANSNRQPRPETFNRPDDTLGRDRGTRPIQRVGTGQAGTEARGVSDHRPEEVLRTPEAPGAGLNYGTLCIVDTLNLLVKAFFAGPPSRINGVRSMLQTCANIIERVSPEYLIFALDGGHDYRSQIYPAYKAHRPPKPPELVEQIALAERAIEAIGWPMIRVKGWEADDVIASLTTQINTRSSAMMVASCDKDLFQLVRGGLVKLYHPWDNGTYLGSRQLIEKYSIKPEQFLDYQALVGDPSDGVPGVDGIGKKKAADLLAEYPDLNAILTAAANGDVKGAVGKSLVAHAESAIVSRRLVELHRGLVIPYTWHSNEATAPNAGWMDALRSMDLGAAAQRLAAVIPITGRVRCGSSKMEIVSEQPECQFTCVISSGGRTNPDLPTNVVYPERRDILPSDETPACRSTDDARPGVIAAAVVVEDEPQPIVAPVSGTFAYPEWIWTTPPFARMPLDAAEVDKCRSVYAGVARDRHKSGKRVASPWKAGSDYCTVWNQAADHQPFSMPGVSNDVDA